MGEQVAWRRPRNLSEGTLGSGSFAQDPFRFVDEPLYPLEVAPYDSVGKCILVEIHV